MLDASELERYARHIVLREVGGPGQAKLKAARVLVVGAGGLGAPVLLYLAAAGVGTLGVVDDDDVSLSNLQRQVIFGTATSANRRWNAPPRRSPAQSACQRQDPHLRLDGANALDLITDYDVVVDGSDDFSARSLVSDACFFGRKPLVTAALGTFDGSLTTIRAHEQSKPRHAQPHLSVPVSRTTAAGSVPARAEAGILGALPGVLGSLMALE